MFEKLKRNSLKKRIEQNLSHRDTSEINAGLRTLGFLVDESILSELELFDSFAQSFGLQPKDVKVFSFQEVKRKVPSLRHNQINNKDFNWKGEISNQNANEFLDFPFDVLVGYYDGIHEFLDLMVSRSNARFKVGFLGGDQRLFDLLINLKPGQMEAFKVELKKYLTVLNKIK